MSDTASDAILAINAGSSSLKITLFENDDGLRRSTAATVERIGADRSRLSITTSETTTDDVDAPDFGAALRVALDRLEHRSRLALAAVGHRIVHGGWEHRTPVAISPALIADLRRLEPLDPTHMPQALALVDSIAGSYGAVPQFACFDTTFHRTMPRLAQEFPLPRALWDDGVRRYGFHGLSCEWIVSALAQTDAAAAHGRLLIAHLGNGASITAVHRGASVDTTMGFSPAGGLMMGTRSGDLDPSVLTYLGRAKRYTPGMLDELITARAGLLGVSGASADMRDLLQRTDSPQAQDAIELYCYSARKHMGALAAVLNGIDAVVFTGGIGEHAPQVRTRICSGLEYLGIAIDRTANEENRPVVSRPDSRVTVRVMPTDEDLVIARHVRRLLA
jgi:acetate kinase